jgi:serine protease inhibitor ecotin
MFINDLNHIEVLESANVQGAGYSYYQNDKIKFDVKTDIDLDDNSAEAFGDAAAYGEDTFSKTVTFAYADDYNSASSSASFAASDDDHYSY